MPATHYWHFTLLTLFAMAETGDAHDLHPIELTAHTVLSGSLDTLHENFELLNQLQYILLARLKLMEDRLAGFRQNAAESTAAVTEKDVADVLARVRAARRKLEASVKCLSKVEGRVEKLAIQFPGETGGIEGG